MSGKINLPGPSSECKIYFSPHDLRSEPRTDKQVGTRKVGKYGQAAIWTDTTIKEELEEVFTRKQQK